MSRPLGGRALKILDRFPSFMRLDHAGKAIGDVALALGGDLDFAEGRLTRILAARRIERAEEEGDILKLAALLGLVEEDFSLLRALYEHGMFDPAKQIFDPPPAIPGSPAPLSEEDEAWGTYSGYLDALRDAVMRTASVMSDGCGTLWALAEGACLLTGASNGGKATLHHVDSFGLTKGFIHRLPATFRVPDGDGWKILESQVYIHENPIIDKQTDLMDARERQVFPVRRGGFFHGTADLRVVGTGKRTIKPLVINQTTRNGYGYRGVLADGQQLTFSRDGHVYLDGSEVTAQCFRVRNGFFDDAERAMLKDPAAPAPLPAPPPPDDGLLLNGFATVDPAGAYDRNQPGPVVVGLASLPPPHLLHGDNTLRFSVEEGAFDASRFDQAVFQLPSDPAALAALPPSGKFQVLWREHQAFTVRVLLPAELKAWESVYLSGASLPALVARGLERFRPAGVRLEADYWNDDWILGESLLEDLQEPTGEGVDFNAPNI
jgi:hypothetical protein